MGVIIKKLELQDYATRTFLYSKEIKGRFNFTEDVHITDKGKEIEVSLFRDIDDIQSLIRDWQDSEELNTSVIRNSGNYGALKLYINDIGSMINNIGNVNIQIKEYNYNPRREKNIPGGKVGIIITLNLENEFDNTKLKADLKKICEGDTI